MVEEDVRPFKMRIVDPDRTCALHSPSKVGWDTSPHHSPRLCRLSAVAQRQRAAARWLLPGGPPSNCAGRCVTTPCVVKADPGSIWPCVDIHQPGRAYRLLQQ